MSNFGVDTVGSRRVSLDLCVDHIRFIISGLRDCIDAASARMDNGVQDSSEYWDEFEVIRDNIEVIKLLEESLNG